MKRELKTHPHEEWILVLSIAFSKRMLEPVGECYQPRIAIREPQESRAETVLGICHIGLVEDGEPLRLESLQIIVRLRCQGFKVHILTSKQTTLAHKCHSLGQEGKLTLFKPVG